MSISLLRYTGLSARSFSSSALAFKVSAAGGAVPTTATKTVKTKTTTATKKDKVVKKTGVDVSKLPVAPKTPASPYSLFFKDFYGKNKGDFTDPATGKFKLAEASRAASLAWSKLSLVESDEFSAAYKSSHAAWTTKYREWYDALSKEDRKAIEAKTGKKLKVPGGKVGSRKAFRELPGNPGRPSSSFFEYLSEIKPELLAQGEREGLSGPKLNTYTAKAAGERWRQLSDADKARYVDKYKEKKARFDEWYAKQPKQP